MNSQLLAAVETRLLHPKKARAAMYYVPEPVRRAALDVSHGLALAIIIMGMVETVPMICDGDV
jgi:hypothetical protein